MSASVHWRCVTCGTQHALATHKQTYKEHTGTHWVAVMMVVVRVSSCRSTTGRHTIAPAHAARVSLPGSPCIRAYKSSCMHVYSYHTCIQSPCIHTVTIHAYNYHTCMHTVTMHPYSHHACMHASHHAYSHHACIQSPCIQSPYMHTVTMHAYSHHACMHTSHHAYSHHACRQSPCMHISIQPPCMHAYSSP